MQQISSPLTRKGKAEKKFPIDKETLVSSYQTQLGVDISRHLPATGIDQESGLYQCSDTGYLFFYPLSLEGDASFYDHITSNENYYSDERWEWSYLLDKIDASEKVLEIGAGGLTFMSMLAKKGVPVEGLEINPSSFVKAEQLGLTLHPKTIQEFADEHPGEYDVVCTFHVLEHIGDVNSFLGSAVRALKPGGRLIISVPNNDSFIKLDRLLALNLPPHHMGRWTEGALAALPQVLPVQVAEIQKQAYSSNYNGWYYSCWHRNVVSKWGIAGKVFCRLAKPFFIQGLTRKQNDLIGPNIMAIYTKK